MWVAAGSQPGEMTGGAAMTEEVGFDRADAREHPVVGVARPHEDCPYPKATGDAGCGEHEERMR